MTRTSEYVIIKMKHAQVGVFALKGMITVKATILKKVREEKGFTQVEVADKANIAIRTYQNYEAGERVPNVHIALSLARVLNSPVEELFPVIVSK